jgi:hypothetical protein
VANVFTESNTFEAGIEIGTVGATQTLTNPSGTRIIVNTNMEVQGDIACSTGTINSTQTFIPSSSYTTEIASQGFVQSAYNQAVQPTITTTGGLMGSGINVSPTTIQIPTKIIGGLYFEYQTTPLPFTITSSPATTYLGIQFDNLFIIDPINFSVIITNVNTGISTPLTIRNMTQYPTLNPPQTVGRTDTYNFDANIPYEISFIGYNQLASGSGGDVSLAGNNPFTGTNSFNVNVPTSTVPQTYPSVDITQLSTISYVNDAIASVPPVPSDIALQNGTNNFTGTNQFSSFCGSQTAQTYPATGTYQFATLGYVNDAIASVPPIPSTIAYTDLPNNFIYQNNFPSIFINTNGLGTTLSWDGTYLINTSAMTVAGQGPYVPATVYMNVVPTQAFVQSAVNSIIVPDIVQTATLTGSNFSITGPNTISYYQTGNLLNYNASFKGTMLTTNNFIGIIIGTALPTTNFEDIQTVQVINTTTGQVISSSGNIGSTSITLNNETGQTYYPQDYSIIIIGSFIIS